MTALAHGVDAPIETVDVAVYVVPTDGPESDGTLAWDHTTLIVVELAAAGQRGLGYTYGDAGAARIIERTLAPAVHGHDAMAGPRTWMAMSPAVPRCARPGSSPSTSAAPPSRHARGRPARASAR